MFQSVPSGGLLIGGDTNLYRGSASQLKTDDDFVAVGAITTATYFLSFGNLHFYNTSTGINFGNGAGVYDTNLYRSSASTLATTGSLSVAGNIAINGTKLYLASGLGLNWGDGGIGWDVNLYRYTSNTLRTDSYFQALHDITCLDGNIYSASSLYLRSDIITEGLFFGKNDDVRLYRSAADTLKTDNSLVVSGSLTLGTSVFRYIPPTDYTPVWSGSASNGSIGNGTLVGRYTLIGRRCFIDMYYSTGSTTVLSTGNWSFSLPFTAGSVQQYVGIAHIRDTGVASYERHIIIQNSGSTLMYFTGLVDGNNVNYITQAYPISWGTGDYIRITVDYEIASTY